MSAVSILDKAHAEVAASRWIRVALNSLDLTKAGEQVT